MADIDILISEVGPRDGLQMARSVMPTAFKKRWIAEGVAAGLTEIEVCSFVPPKLVPAMADATEVTEYAATFPGLTVAVLAPNLKGAENAVKAGANKITVPISVSESHNRANVNKSRAESLQEIQNICTLRDALPEDQRPVIEGGLSTVWGCTIEGAVSEDEVLRLSEALIEAGVDEIGLADTTGMADPAGIKRVFTKVYGAVGKEKLAGAHLHNTRGLGLANALAALEVGVTTLDASLAGLGGCPFAPGASGNIVTEDLVYMLEEMGLSTGIDVRALITMRAILEESLPDEPLYGFIAEVGPEKGGKPVERVAAA
ncbi:MAG: hydroxymethylglutaryl-CoA lyase [Hyphomicrobiales bacterium]|nr:hydroxymethylglutaryl-CoA lyase [Hyphomicrobiales bacterium]